MSYQKQLAEDIKDRLQKVQKQIQVAGADACILSSTVNIFYIAGVVYAGYAYIPAEGDIIHFVKRPQGVALENVTFVRKPEQIIEELGNRELPAPEKVLIETDSANYTECCRLINSLAIKEVMNASTFMRKIRSVKSDFELQQTRACARKHEAVYKLIPSLFKKGMTDVELQIEIERQMRLYGSMGIFRAYGENMDIFMGSILTGENAESPSPFDYALGGHGANPTLPIGASGEEIKEGYTIMIDMAGNYSPWMTDMTRVFSLGRTTELAYKAHQVSIEICNTIESYAKVGTPCADLYNTAMEMTKKNGLEAYFMGTKQQAKFVGHGVGLEINEVPVLTPRSKEVFEENVVFALEPKFVIPEIGAVGIENTYAVTASGLEKITLFEEGIIDLG
ncbi:Xaa-Pro peptidase family protein [Dysgonomonas sp. 520]|uniref:M24 family metallopeptidase n=1 Tax=Dysgonomonas sp. 520 TaxID=2302931 RepID=UPI0013D304D4|nr:Xaa-Pro peptidase family protein [Dysgonomonas sp. 520]NDW09433.1 aminopeptidase P family protein [Dysgonomonas sp. 520]